MKENIYTASIITVSDSCSQGEREDLSGKAIFKFLSDRGLNVLSCQIAPDDTSKIVSALKTALKDNPNLIFTTGGTGFSTRDVTPEATSVVIERNAPGIAEAIRHYSLQITPRAMLSRGIAGICKNTIIINLPGSPKAVEEALSAILESLFHGVDILLGNAHNCARG